MSGDRYYAIRPCPISAACANDNERGWRLVVQYERGSGSAYFSEEQVLPERVRRIDANRVLADNGRIGLNLDEAIWLRAQLDDLIPLLAEDLSRAVR
jgi:hypothetical protein